MHRLDPRSKLIACLTLMTCLLLTFKAGGLCVGAGVCALAVSASRIPVGVFTRNLKPFAWLFLITFCIHGLTTDGDVLLSLPLAKVAITKEGLFNAGLYTVRMLLLIVLAAWLTLTTAPIELTDGLERLLIPLKRLKLPVHEFVLMVTLSLRFLPILIQEAERIKNAQLSRGASLDGPLVRRVRNIVPMVVPLFLSAIRRADELAMALEARHYVGGEGRTSFGHLRLKQVDYGVLLFSFAFVVFMVELR